MATTKTAKTEALPDREKRQDAEVQDMITRQQDAMNAKIADNELRRAQAVLLDDTAEVRRLDAERESLIKESAQLQRDIEDKQHALAHTRRLIQEANRAEQVKLARAYIATVKDIAPPLEETAADFFDFVKRYVQQLRGAEQALRQLGDVSAYSGSPLSVGVPELAAWIINRLVDEAGLPIRAECREQGAWLRLETRGTLPTDLARHAASVMETTR